MASMKYMAAIFFVTIIVGSVQSAAASSQSDAREVARINNCPPKKIEVFQQSLGSEAQTIYQVECTMPKVTGESAQGSDALLIGCQDSMCTLLRPITLDKK